MLTRRDFVRIASLDTAPAGGDAMAGPSVPGAQKNGKLDAPRIRCVRSTSHAVLLSVCAGSSGAPAGFSVHWLTTAQYEAGPDGRLGTKDDRTFGSSAHRCGASFSGHANGVAWNLPPNGCATVVIGGLNDADVGVSFANNEPLAAGTAYTFRAFAHATRDMTRSDFSAMATGVTAASDVEFVANGNFCTRGRGYYASGGDSLSAALACFPEADGGTGGTAATKGVSGEVLLTIGGGIFSYRWVLTDAYQDVPCGPQSRWVDNGLVALRRAIEAGGTSGYFTENGLNPANMGTGGGLASQVAALTFNLAGCGTRLCGARGGTAYGSVTLCRFKAGDTFKNNGEPVTQDTADALNGQAVSDVLAAANAYLGGHGTVPLPFGLSSATDLAELVANLNLAFDGRDWDHDGIDDCDCGGASHFALAHLRKGWR